ncbi:hypothetical protein SCO11_09655 [Legionella pneumophila serogroup 1]|uniref:hypothetical protein n=1 Tax=Legionella pneumophila TaxID=446 RepID=UPI0005B4CCBB|nr:hypothetical protein [Legionella pneumophila]ANN91270.1 hypothetical protein A9P85_00975 [Legionella pneumophila]MCZ4679299.1 hypothetical protein [Legionella pneumophila]MCZ4749264.1 hypothetical protein [Legionella pneumophila]MDW8863633.1 hypothetical protein [Legionella pneumophila]MDW8888220.1 hypothetical protein [Legionella pneumophila]
MKIQTQIHIDSKRYPRALSTAKKLKKISDSLDPLNKEEVVFLGYISSCVALEAFINYMLYIFAQEVGSLVINKRFNRMKAYFESITYHSSNIKEDESVFLKDKQKIEYLLNNFQSKYFLEINGEIPYNKRNDVLHGNLNAVRFWQEVNSELEHNELLKQQSTPEKIDEFYNYGLSTEIFHEMFDDCNELIFRIHEFFQKYIDYSSIQLAKEHNPSKEQEDRLGRMQALDHFIHFPYDHEYKTWSASASVISK